MRNLVVTASDVEAVNLVKQRLSSLKRYSSLQKNLSMDNNQDLANLLNSIPVISKSDLIKLGNDAYSQPESKIMLFSETTGTTGNPLSTPRGQDEFSWNTYNQANAYRRHLQPGLDRIAILHPSVMSPFVEVSARALQELGIGYVRIYPIPSVCDYERIYKILEFHGITAIMSTPTLIYKMIYELKKVGNGVLPLMLSKLLLTGELVSKAALSNMDQVLGRDIGAARSFVYGSSEVATVMFGTEDATYRGYLKDFIFEIEPFAENWIDDLDRPEGSTTGKLIITWLRDGIMPMLRYDTGDIFTVWKNQHADWVFLSEGRNSDDGLNLDLRGRLTDLVYRLTCPIYKYNFLINNKNILLLLITNEFNPIERDAIKKQVISELENVLNDWSIRVIINPKDDLFYKFSPVPKTKYFQKSVSC